MPGVILTSAMIVGAWGYFLVQGVRDPLGGINSLWPLFGIANQLLAAVALSVATTVLVRMHGARYMWITAAPLGWLVVVTFAAGWQKIFSPLPRVGFLAQAAELQARLAQGTLSVAQAAETRILVFNAQLDAAVCGVFLVLVGVILITSVRLWVQILSGAADRRLKEAPYVATSLAPEEL